MKKRYKTRSWESVLIRIGIVACILVMIYAGYHIYIDMEEDLQGGEAYKTLRETVLIKHPPAFKQEVGEKGETANDLAASSRREMYDDTESSLVVDFTALRELASGAVAWIYSEGTKIDYPVVQGKDNDYYLNHLYNGSSNVIGSVFLDYRNSADFSDQNSVLFGHHMQNGTMFGSLEKYKKQTYYTKHPTLELYTQDANYRIELIAGYVADGSVNDLELDGMGGDELLSFVKSAKSKSTFFSDAIVTATDRLITMVTCTYDFNNARYVLVGKLVKFR